ncbi:fibronectin type III domain-containing protein [Anaerovoracaceae bacterium 42-11]
MKKFLTVLLALSVVFTYSFSAVGTVFADATDDAKAKAKSDLISYIDEVEAEGAKMIADNGDVKYNSTWEVTAENWKLAYAKAYNDFVKTVTEKTDFSATTAGGALNEVVGAGTVDDAAADKETIKLAVKQYLANATTGQAYTNAVAVVPALKAQLAEDKVAEAKKVDAVDTSIYSTTTYTEKTASDSYAWGVYAYTGKADAPTLADTLIKDADKELYVAKEVAEKALAEVKVGLEVIATVGATDTADRLVARHTAMTTLMSNYIVETEDELYGTYTYTLKDNAIGSKNPLTIAQEKGDAEISEADILAKKAQINKNIVDFRNGNVYNAAAATAKEKAEYDKYLAAYKTAETYLVDNKIAGHPTTIAISQVSETASLIKKVNAAADAIEEAAALKAETNDDGSAKYDAETIDENLATILLALYDATNSKTSYTTAELSGNAIAYITNAEKANYKSILKDVVDTYAMTVDYKLDNGFITEDKSHDPVTYYDLEWKAVEAAVDAYYAAVDAAKTNSDVKDAAKAFDKTMSKIDDQTAVKAIYSNLSATLDNEFAKLKLDAGKLNVGNTDDDTLVFEITDFNVTNPTLLKTYADGTLLKFYIDNDARTAAEITALYDKAYSLLASAKSKATLQSEAKKVKDMIAALPAAKDITVADKAAIEAAYDALEALPADYQKYVTNVPTLNAAIDAVKAAEGKEIQKAKRELPLLSAVTIADKAAVQKVADMIAAYAGTEMYNAPDFEDRDVNALLDAIKDLELAALKKAVKAIPAVTKITAEDKATVEVARAAYDAYLADYGDELTPNEFGALAGFEQTIVKAENALADALAKDKAAQIKAVESFKLKVTTKRYTGKKMRVNWTVVSGDESAIDGYRVYYSTKKSNSGYKYLTKTTKKYINHTSIKKSVKKGTRVYYRVRAYKEIDGVRYFSDYSTVGNRIWK